MSWTNTVPIVSRAVFANVDPAALLNIPPRLTRVCVRLRVRVRPYRRNWCFFEFVRFNRRVCVIFVIITNISIDYLLCVHITKCVVVYFRVVRRRLRRGAVVAVRDLRRDDLRRRVERDLRETRDDLDFFLRLPPGLSRCDNEGASPIP